MDFVIWGALHGVALAVTRIRQRARASAAVWAGGAVASAGATRWLATLATFHFVCFAWVFFRAPTFDHAVLALRQLAVGGWKLEHVTPKVAWVIAAAALLHAVPRDWEGRVREWFVRTPAVVQGLVLATAAVVLHLVAGAKPEPFVYGQF